MLKKNVFCKSVSKMSFDILLNNKKMIFFYGFFGLLIWKICILAQSV